MKRDEMIQAIRAYLGDQLQEDGLAQELAMAVHDCLLDWTAPPMETTDIGAILAYSFGYRRLPNGNIVPGPMNAELAEVAVALHAKAKCRVFAQWEIAEAIGSRIPSDMLHAVHPEISPRDGSIKYLSTVGVTQKIVDAIRDPKTLGKVLIVAWRDHALRCVRIARRFGFDAFVPEEPLPQNYDALSGQAWTRNRHAYLVHDGLARLETYRAEVIRSSSPSGQLD